MGWQQLSPTCACFAVPCCCQGLSFVHRSIAHGSMAFAGLGKAGTNACSNHFSAVLPSQMIPGAQVTGECPGYWNGPFTASCASSSCGSKTHLFLPSSQPHHLKVFQISFPEVSNLLEYFEVRTSRCAHSWVSSSRSWHCGSEFSGVCVHCVQSSTLALSRWVRSCCWLQAGHFGFALLQQQYWNQWSNSFGFHLRIWFFTPVLPQTDGFSYSCSNVSHWYLRSPEF